MGEDPYLVAMLGVGLRAGAAERRRRRHAQALRRLLGLAGRPQPRPGVDGPPRAARHDPADRSRPRSRSAARRLGDELLLRRRRRARRRRPVAAHRAAARRVGLHRHRRVRLLGGAVPGLHAPGRRRHRRRRGAGAGRRASTSSCRTPSASARSWSSGSRRGEVAEELVDRAARRLLPQKVRARPARPGLDAGGRRSPRRPSVDLDSPANRALARELAERSVVLLDPGTALPLLGRAAGAAPGRRRRARARTTRARSWAATPSPTTCCPATPSKGLGIDVPTAVDALRAELPDAGGRPRSPGCAVLGRRPSGFAAAVEAARGADVCVAFVGDLAGLFGLGTSGEGCDAEDLRLPGVQARAARRAARDRHAGRRRGRLRPAVRAGRRCTGRAAGAGPGVHARRGGRRGDRRRTLRAGPAGRQAAGADPARAGRPARHLPAAAARRRTATGISNLDPTPLFPFGHGRSYTTLRGRRPAAQRRRGAAPTASSRSPCGWRNTGGRAGDEVVQLYLHDVLAQVTRPVRQLAGFARVPLRARGGGRRDVPRARRPDRVHRPRPRRGSSSPATSRCSSAPRPPTCRAAARSGSPARARRRARPPAATRPVERRGRPGSERAEGRRRARTAGGRRWRRSPRPPASRSPPCRKVLNGRSDVAADDPGAGRRTCSSSTSTSRRARGRAAPPRRPSSWSSTGDCTPTPPRWSRACSTPAVEAASVAVSAPRADGVAAGRRFAERLGPRPRRRRAAGGRRGRPASSPPPHLAALDRAQVPVVVIDPLNPRSPGSRASASTNFAGGMAATEHLLALGHRRIGYVGGTPTAACNQARMHGLRAALEAAGAPLPPEYVTGGELRLRRRVRRRRRAARPARAADGDLRRLATRSALGVIEAARVRGLRVPQDLSVMGFDDTQLARMASPPLTTVRQPLSRDGRRGAADGAAAGRGEKRSTPTTSSSRPSWSSAGRPRTRRDDATTCGPTWSRASRGDDRAAPGAD